VNVIETKICRHQNGIGGIIEYVIQSQAVYGYDDAHARENHGEREILDKF